MERKLWARARGDGVSLLLINESPLVCLPALAKELGSADRAIVLQQIHYWIERSDKEYQGKVWIYKKTEVWVDEDQGGELCFMANSTLKRILKYLEDRNLICRAHLSSVFGRNSFDRTTYFAINYEEMEKLELEIKAKKLARKKAKAIKQNPLGQIDPMEAKPSDCALVQIDPIDKVILTQSIESDCTNQLGLSDPIRLGQLDPMITENTTKTTTEITTEITSEREALPELAPSNLFAINTSIVNNFSMTENWQPTEKFTGQCKFRAVNLNAFSPDDQEDLINEFRSYWMTQSTQLNQAGWEHKLIGSLKRSQERKTRTPSSAQSTRAIISAAIMNIEDTNW